jgi:outer membrane receptor protein involved in Fe transport
MYSRSLGGVFYDTSVRLEPTQIAGFNQAFRSIAPESVTGLLPGSEFDTWGLAWDQDYGRGTYLTVSGEILKSDSERTAGLFARSATNLFLPTFPSGTRQKIEFEERSVNVVLNQLVGQWVALGAHYRVSQAELRDRYPDIPEAVFQSPTADVEATLQQMRLLALANHPSGLFGQAESLWSHQTSSGYSPGLPGEDFWQFNAFVGYRFWQRRVEARLGILNLTDQDYRLNPLNLHAELPRERTFTVSLKFQF